MYNRTKFYFFFVIGPPISSNCVFNSSSSLSGTNRISSWSSLCSTTLNETPSGNAACTARINKEYVGTATSDNYRETN